MKIEDARYISAHLASRLPRGIVGDAEGELVEVLLRQIQVLADPTPGNIWLCEDEKDKPTAHWLATGQDGREHILSATAHPSGGPGWPRATVTTEARPLRAEAWVVDLKVEQKLHQPDLFETSWTFWYGGYEFLAVLGERQAMNDSWEEWTHNSAEQFARLLASKVGWPIDVSFV